MNQKVPSNCFIVLRLTWEWKANSLWCEYRDNWCMDRIGDGLGPGQGYDQEQESQASHRQH